MSQFIIKPSTLPNQKGEQKKSQFYFVIFSATYESRVKVLHIFSTALFILTKITLIQFLDDSYFTNIDIE